MKRLVLVNPPNHHHDVYNLSPPLGLMVLAEIGLEKGFEPIVIDFDLPPANAVAADLASFYSQATQRILASDPHVVAITSMGVNSHVALQIAQGIKESNPEILIALGGPHLSSIHRELVGRWPWFDAIIVGEGEEAFRGFLNQVRQEHRVPGHMVLRSPTNHIPRHPFAAYDYIGLRAYFASNSRRLVNYEGGRGCVFRCAFCYSPGHFDSVRDVPPKDVVSEWQRLSELGVRHIFMVQDNLTNSPGHAIALCDAIAAAALPITWNCYATLPQLTSEVIRSLGRARCQSVYLGVDAVSETQKVSFNKRFFQSNEALASRVRELRDNGVLATCALMADLYAYDEDDFEQVLRTAAVCADAGAAIRINTFTRYPGTSLGAPGASRARYSEAKVRLMLDCPEVVCQNDLAKEWPALFPFHATEVDDEQRWAELLQTIRTAQRQVNRHPAFYHEIPAEDGVRPLSAAMQALARGGGISDDLDDDWATAQGPNDAELF